jgi:hypothetical protein
MEFDCKNCGKPLKAGASKLKRTLLRAMTRIKGTQLPYSQHRALIVFHCSGK